MSTRRPRTRFVPRAPNVAFVAAVPIAIIAIVIPLGLVLPAMGYPIPPWAPLAAIGLILLLMGLFLARIMFFTRRIARSDGFLCLNCHYDLHGLPDSGNCPECGESYVRAELERRWNIWLLSQTKNRQTVRPRSQTGSQVREE